jgi:hypothetical protein
MCSIDMNHNITQEYLLVSISIFVIIKPTRCTISQIYFGDETLHVPDSSSVHHPELFTV